MVAGAKPPLPPGRCPRPTSAIATVIVLAAAVGAAYLGGTFYAFSTFVMRALGDLTGVDGARAMQAINRRAIDPAYMIGLSGTAAGLGVFPTGRRGIGARRRLGQVGYQCR